VSPGPLFSASWAAALGRELAADPEFLRAAQGSGAPSLLLRLEPDPAQGVFSGRALVVEPATAAVRPAEPGDDEGARFRLVAPPDVWLDLLEGGLEPAPAVTSGRLRVEGGSLFALLPQLGLARCLLACARRIGSGDRLTPERS
jgi:hypothetical protein